MSKYEPIDVVVDGIRCYWQVMASFGEHRYTCRGGICY